MKPNLSIIIPCYNCERTLEEAVLSCFNQGLKQDDFEIVMVDDKSTDNTVSIMKNLCGKYSNISAYYHEINKGGGATRNTAVSKTKADIIFCLDSDDMLAPDTLNRMLNYIHTKKCDAVGVHRSVKFIGNDVNKIHKVDIFGYVDNLIPIDSLLQKNNILCSLYSTFMFTKKSFNTVGGYPTSHGFDTQGIAWRYLLNNLIAYTCPNTTYLHRVKHSKSYYLREYFAGRINDNWRQIFMEHIYIFNKEVRDFIINYNLSSDKNIFEEICKMENVFTDKYDPKNRDLHYSNTFNKNRDELRLKCISSGLSINETVNILEKKFPIQINIFTLYIRKIIRKIMKK